MKAKYSLTMIDMYFEIHQKSKIHIAVTVLNESPNTTPSKCSFSCDCLFVNGRKSRLMFIPRFAWQSGDILFVLYIDNTLPDLFRYFVSEIPYNFQLKTINPCLFL